MCLHLAEASIIQLNGVQYVTFDGRKAATNTAAATDSHATRVALQFRVSRKKKLWN